MKRFLYLIITDRLNSWWTYPLKVILWFFSLLYACGIFLRMFFYKTGLFREKSLGRPVISIGNLTIGGAGKSPMVAMVAGHFKDKEVKCAILTRGYMGEFSKFSAVTSDEATMLSEQLEGVPIIVGPDRWQSGHDFARQYPVDVFILDDGFQHRKLKRDLDIVIINATDPWGNEYLLPRGTLREPLDALRRAQIFILTKVNLGENNVGKIKQRLNAINPQALVVEAIHEPYGIRSLTAAPDPALSNLKNKEVVCFSSIADPDSFEGTLNGLGAHVLKRFDFMDHHVYSEKDVRTLVNFCHEKKTRVLITTEKDAVKLNEFSRCFENDIEALALKIKMTITDRKEQFLGRVDSLLLR